MSKRIRGPKGQPWYRERNDTWYITINGKQLPLAKGKDNKDKALKNFYGMMASADAPEKGDTNPVKVVFDLYLKDLRGRCEPETFKFFLKTLRSFKDTYPEIQVKDLRPSQLDNWFQNVHPTWNDGTKRNAILILQSALNWAASAKSGQLIPNNPMKGIFIPPGRSRGIETLVPHKDHDRLISLVPEDLRNFLITLRNTGTRPGNIARVTAKDFFPEQGVWRLQRHKTAKKTGQPLIVSLPSVVIELCKNLAQKYPEGPLFRTSSGKRWTPQSLASRIIYYRRKAGLNNLIAYGYRHTVATELLEKGAEDSEVAALLGHRNTNMVHRHYSHLQSRTKRLRQILTDRLSPTPLEQQMIGKSNV